MDTTLSPTKGNLIKAKATLSISKMGYDLMDKKRNVLIHEIMELNQRAAQIQSQIETTFNEAYLALQDANIEMGFRNVEMVTFGIPKDNSLKVKARSIMGVEIPIVTANETHVSMQYGFGSSSTSLDKAYIKFLKVKELIISLASVENAAYRLAVNIKKTQKRANALKNITIPKYEEITKTITETLEERERDEFVRLKVIKKGK